MAKSCGTCRHKSFKRRAEVKLTSSLPARLLCMPALQSSRALWWLPTMFYWGRHLHLTHSSYYKGPLQWRNSPLQLLLLHQCPSSLLGPKDGALPQILWRACLWVEPHLRWLWKGFQLQVARDPALEQSAQAELCGGIWLGLLTWWRRPGRNSSRNIPTTSSQRAPVISQRYLGRWPQAPSYWALPSMRSRHHGWDQMN